MNVAVQRDATQDRDGCHLTHQLATSPHVAFQLISLMSLSVAANISKFNPKYDLTLGNYVWRELVNHSHFRAWLEGKDHDTNLC